MAVRTCELCSYTLCNRVDERCLTQHNMHVTRYKVCGPVDVIPYSHNIALKASCALDFITWTPSAPFDHRGRHTKGGARPTKTERSIGREKTQTKWYGYCWKIWHTFVWEVQELSRNVGQNWRPKHRRVRCTTQIHELYRKYFILLMD